MTRVRVPAVTDDAEADEDGDGASDEAQQVADVFKRHERLLSKMLQWNPKNGTQNSERRLFINH